MTSRASGQASTSRRASPHKNVGVRFRCAKCDPNNKWFDYNDEEVYIDSSGLWHLKNDNERY